MNLFKTAGLLGFVCIALSATVIAQSSDYAWMASAQPVPASRNIDQQVGENPPTLEMFQKKHQILSKELEEAVVNMKKLLHEADLLKVENYKVGSPEEKRWEQFQANIQAVDQQIARIQMEITNNEVTYYFMMEEIKTLERLNQGEEIK